MKFEIKNRWTGEVKFTAEIDAVESTPLSLKIGLAVKWAIETRANLTGADLTVIRDDLWAVLCSSPREVPALRETLIAGRVNGSCYEGDCACLVGTLANARHCNFHEIPGLTPDSSRPAERFFLAIKKGDTPHKNMHAKLAVDWIDQWAANMATAFMPINPGTEVANVAANSMA